MTKRLALKDDSQKMDAPFSNVAVAGLGLIGSSLAGALKRAYPDIHLFGVDPDSRSGVVARERGWADEASTPDDPAFAAFLADQADLLIIATPVAAVDGYLKLISEVGFSGVVTDTVSTKSHILDSARDLLADNARYIPGHPMAGSEASGIDGARTDLFEGANWILCPDGSTDPDSFQKLHELICGIDARVVSLPREDHDRAVAVVSHVPHMVASSLMRLALDHADANNALMRLAAGGFKDTTRVAAGSPELWCGIAFDNADALASGLHEMEDIISSYARAIEERDAQGLKELLRISADARQALPAQWVPGSDKLLEVRIPMINRTGVVAEVTTIASSVGCNIQSIEIDHLSEGNAVLSLMLTDEGDIGQLSFQLIDAGYTVSFRPIEPKEHAHV